MSISQIPKIKTFFSYSFGCRVNQAEKELLDRELTVSGFQYSEEKPDIYIINTCAVTAKAEREARQFIYQTRRKFPHTKIIVTGCAATKWKKENETAKGIDLIIDNVDKEKASQIIRRKLFPPIANIDYYVSGRIGNNLYFKDKFLGSGRLLLKIQDGCQRFCTYCIVPCLRGSPKSVPIKEIINSIHSALMSNHSPAAFSYIKRGNKKDIRIWSKTPARWPADKDSWQVEESRTIKEVILTAINTEAYGYDTGESLIGLVNSIINNTKVPRISFGSIHPWSINEEFIKFYRSILPLGRLVKFFHIPLQSGSNKILALMKRGYTRKEFMEKLKAVEKVDPYTFIGTDIITGFLAETEKDFEDTYNFLKDSPISKFHVFRYSKRAGTAAYFMAKNLKEPTPEQKAKRAKALIELGRIKYQKFLEKHLGKTFPALFLERKSDGYEETLLDNQIPIFIKTADNLTGTINNIKVNVLKKGRFIGDLI